MVVHYSTTGAPKKKRHPTKCVYLLVYFACFTLVYDALFLGYNILIWFHFECYVCVYILGMVGTFPGTITTHTLWDSVLSLSLPLHWDTSRCKVLSLLFVCWCCFFLAAYAHSSCIYVTISEFIRVCMCISKQDFMVGRPEFTFFLFYFSLALAISTKLDLVLHGEYQQTIHSSLSILDDEHIWDEWRSLHAFNFSYSVKTNERIIQFWFGYTRIMYATYMMQIFILFFLPLFILTQSFGNFFYWFWNWINSILYNIMVIHYTFICWIEAIAIYIKTIKIWSISIGYRNAFLFYFF